MKVKSHRIWLFMAFGAIYFVWGTTYLANMYALRGLTPFIISALRYLTAGMLLALFAWRKGVALPKRSDMTILAITGVAMLVGGSGLVVVAEQYIPSGTAAVIIAVEPFLFVLMDKPRWKEYFSNKLIIAGLLLGVGGLALFAFATRDSGMPQQTEHRLAGMGLVVLSGVLWVSGTLFSARRITPGSYNFWHTAIQLIAAGIFASVIALLNGEWSGFAPGLVPLHAWLGLSFLIVFGSLIAYLAFVWLVTVQPPAIVSTHTIVNPAVAVFIGWLVLDEVVTVTQVIALLVALTGVVFTQVSKKGDDRQIPTKAEDNVPTN